MTKEEDQMMKHLELCIDKEIDKVVQETKKELSWLGKLAYSEEAQRKGIKRGWQIIIHGYLRFTKEREEQLRIDEEI